MYFERNKTYRNTFDYHVDASLSTSNTLQSKEAQVVLNEVLRLIRHYFRAGNFPLNMKYLIYLS